VIDYRTREGYKNLRIGRTRFVYARAEDSFIRNLTFYLYLDKDYMLDFIISKWNFSVDFRTF
jgi:hypothetical protein